VKAASENKPGAFYIAIPPLFKKANTTIEAYTYYT